MTELLRRVARRPAQSEAYRSEPVGTITAAINGAVVSTVNVIALVAKLPDELVIAINACLGAWIVVAALVVHALRR